VAVHPEQAMVSELSEAKFTKNPSAARLKQTAIGSRLRNGLIFAVLLRWTNRNIRT